MQAACLKNPAKSLELLSDVTPEVLAQAEALIESGKVVASVSEKEKGLYVKCALRTEQGEAVLRVSDGICARTPEQCIQNVARIGIRGMAGADKEILEIMTGADKEILEIMTGADKEILEIMTGADTYD